MYMAHAHSNCKNNRAAAASVNAGGENEVKPATFHDFLGDKAQPQESAPPAAGGGRPPPDVSPSATSDLGSGEKLILCPFLFLPLFLFVVVII